MPFPWDIAEEVCDALTVVPVVTSAVYWWKSSRVPPTGSDALRGRLNARAALSAAIAAVIQTLAVLTHVFQLADWLW
jgi:hypothetical protein